MLLLSRLMQKLKRSFSPFLVKNRKLSSLKDFPASADVVIIGGGSAGCHASYFLAKRGVNVVLMERSKLTAGTTWHTAGLLWQLRPSDVDIQLLGKAINLMHHLKTNTEYDPGFINNGGLYIAHNQTRMDEYKRLATIGRLLNIENYILTANEIRDQVFPLCNPKSFLGGLYVPGDGVVDPAMLVTSLTKEASRNGAKIFENCPVWNIAIGDNILGHKEVQGVQTPFGTIKTNTVVNATGVWGRDLVEKIGIHLPLVPMKHAYIIGEPMDGVKGMPNVRDHDASIYLRIQGQSICLGGYEENPILIDRVPNDFNFGLYELDWSTFEKHVAGTDALCPAFSRAGVKSTVCGPESFTPDHKPLMGHDPLLHGLFHSCGFNSAGMMFGAGCGEQLAHWIVHGRPEMHLFNFDIRRFSPQQRRNAEWSLERSHEAYAKNYSAIFKHDQPLAGRNFKKDPIHEVLLSKGAVMEEKMGWERPGFYVNNEMVKIQDYDWQGYYGKKKHLKHRHEELVLGDCKYTFSDHHNLIGEEAMSCRTNAVLLNLNYFCKLFLHGSQAKEAADWIFTADTNKDANSVIYTCALNKFGGVESDLTVTPIESGNGQSHSPKIKGRGYYIVAGGASAIHTIAHINECIKEKSFHVQLNDVTDRIGIISIQGPNSTKILQKLTDFDLNSKLPPYKSALIDLKTKSEKCNARVLRVSFVGELGYEVHIPERRCVDIYEAISGAGQEFDIRNAGYRSFYSLSCEKGFHLWDFDLRCDDTPIEANLGFTCRRSGNYKGKNAVEQQRTNGIQKKLVYLTLDEDIPIWGLEGVYRNGEPVGHLRRAEYGYFIKKFIGRTYIHRSDGQPIDNDFVKSGNYEIDILGRKYQATCHLKSPFDPENHRIHGNYVRKLMISGRVSHDI